MLGHVLGLTTDEASAYRELLTMSPTSAAELADRLGDGPANALRTLLRLEDQGLIARSGSDSSRFVASPPSVAVGALLMQRQNEMRLAEIELGSLDALYRAGATARQMTDVVDVVRGASALSKRLEQLQMAARDEVLAFVKPPITVLAGSDNTAEHEAVARGVHYRVVLERGMFQEDPNLNDDLMRSRSAGELMQVAVADHVPLKMFVVDRTFALVPMADHPDNSTPSAMLVHASGLLDALVALFEQVWSAANQLVSTADGIAEIGPDRIDDVDAQILSLLLAGLTDEAVAKQLRTSLRTVQRRTRHLMDLARVETRIQLGWKAATLGWV